MKNEKISVFVLAVEIVAIICLHSMKGNMPQDDKTNVINISAAPAEPNKIDNQLSIPLYTVYTIKY